MHYDIIGDLHGHADALEALLRKMDYAPANGAWRHSERTAVFVGDFIDRGPQQRRTVELVRAMVESGAALAVMGNHELNAIAWHTPHPDGSGDFLRPHHLGDGAVDVCIEVLRAAREHVRPNQL